jgi:adenylylsulfate kinase
MKILIMGLSGAGKTTLANELVKRLDSVEWFNADIIRTQYNDWDFSNAGRLRQSNRMHHHATNSPASYVICDFIAPTDEIRKIFNADFTIFVDTIMVSKYNDTNYIFQPPVNFDVKVTSQDCVYWANQIVPQLYAINNINNSLNFSLNNFVT